MDTYLDPHKSYASPTDFYHRLQAHDVRVNDIITLGSRRPCHHRKATACDMNWLHPKGARRSWHRKWQVATFTSSPILRVTDLKLESCATLHNDACWPTTEEGGWVWSSFQKCETGTFVYVCPPPCKHNIHTIWPKVDGTSFWMMGVSGAFS